MARPPAFLSTSTNLSVPSSSGKTLQYGARFIRKPPVECFQSPLHRGRLFNFGCWQPLCGQCVLSVPSSSGKTLQLQIQGTQDWLRFAFSPLFIGEDSSIGCRRGGSRARTALSVPSSSGKTLQLEVKLISVLSDGLSVPSSSGKTLQ